MWKLFELLAETKNDATEQLPVLVINTSGTPIYLGLRAIAINVHEDFVRQSIDPLIIRHCSFLESSNENNQRRNLTFIRVAKRTKAQADH